MRDKAKGASLGTPEIRCKLSARWPGLIQTQSLARPVPEQAERLTQFAADPLERDHGPGADIGGTGIDGQTGALEHLRRTVEMETVAVEDGGPPGMCPHQGS